MSDEILIEEVRKHPCLYDMTDRKYLDTKYKTTLWIKIARILDSTEVVVRKRWVNIRDQYKRSLNKTKTVSGQAATFVKKYRYAEQLEFLNAYFVDRGTLSNINVDEESASTPSGSNIPPAPESEAGPSSAPQGRNLELEHGTPVVQFRAPSRGTLRSVRAHSATARPRPYHTADELFRLIQEREPKKKPDLIDDFCTSLASTIRTFPPFLQNKAKGRLFSVLQEIELEHILGVSSPIRDVDDIPRPCSSREGGGFEEVVQERQSDPINFSLLDPAINRSLSRVEMSKECLASSSTRNTSNVGDTPETSTLDNIF